jgi:hypothetical protein
METDGSGQSPQWPFLVSRGRELGYRVVLAPDFLHASGEPGLLYPIVEGGSSYGSDVGPRVRVRTLHAQDGRAVTAIFREVVPDGGELGLPAGMLRDADGRGIAMFEGYIVDADGRGHPPASFVPSPRGLDWREAHTAALAALRQLLAAEADGVGSEEVRIGVSSPVSRPVPLDPPPDRGRPWLLVVLAVVAVLAGLGVVATAALS